MHLKKANWIKAKENPPTTDAFFLTWDGSYQRLCFYDENEFIWRDGEWMDWDVTHYQPLPEPPDED